MKKILMSAAVASMMMVGCQNKDIVSEISDNGEMFTLEINQGTGSRTEWGQNGETRWSTGDKIYVTSEDGTVTGVLTFQGGNKFKGFVYGGDASKLTHVLYPVPENGQIKINQPTGNKIGLPMMGELNQSKTGANLDNLCALVKMPVEGAKDVTLADEGGLLTGHYEYNDGEIVFVPGEGNVIIPVVDGAALFATSTQDEAGNTVNEVEITVNNGTDTYFIPVTQGEIETEDVPSIEISGNEVEATMNVTTEAILEKALNEYAEVKLAGDIEIGEAGITISSDAVTVDLNGFALVGRLIGEGIDQTNITIIDTSEVYDRNPSLLTFSSLSLSLQGGTYVNDVKNLLAQDGDYVSVKNGDFWVVLPKASVVVYNEATHGNVNNSDFHNLIMNAENGSIFYLTEGTYRLNDGSSSRFTDKSFTLVGLEGAVIEGQKYGMVLDATTEGYEINLKNLTITSIHSWGHPVYAKNYITVNLYDVTCENPGKIAILLDSGNPINDKHIEGVTTKVNAFNVTIDNDDTVEFMAKPNKAYLNYYDDKKANPYLYLTTTDIVTNTEFNYVGGNINICKAQDGAYSTGNNMLVNAVKYIERIEIPTNVLETNAKLLKEKEEFEKQ